MLTKEEKIRREAMAFAYHIVKSGETPEDGIRKLEDRLDRNQKTNCPVYIKDQALRNFESEVKKATMTTMTALSMMTLSTKFGFSGKTLQQFVEEYIELADTVYGGWLEWHEIIDYIKEECGVDIMEYIAKATEIMDNMEEQLNKRKLFVGNRKQQ